MRKRLNIAIGMIAVLPLLAGTATMARANNSGSIHQTEFSFRKGINISAWLSQTSVTEGAARTAYFTQKDVAQLAALGFDHIRLPVAESQLYTNGQRNEETFQLIHNVIKWCQAANLRIILDCHQTHDHDFSKYAAIVLWTDPAAPARFIQLWQHLSAEFHQYPNTLLAYELLNEPNAKSAQSWNTVSAELIKALRRLEPERILFLGSNKAQRVTTFTELTFPEDDPNIILSFHFYYPYLLTHYGADFIKNLKDLKVPINYPGLLVNDSAVAALSPEARKTLQSYNGVYDKQVMYNMIRPVIEKAKAAGLRLHCGEFGSNFQYPDHSVQLRWMQDLVSVFKENHIPYTVWGYRKQFGVFNDAGEVKDAVYLDALVK